MFEVPQPATALHRFAETHHEAIQHAGFLLGGQAALHRAQSLLDDLSCGGQMTRRMFQEDASLHALFAGETSVAAGEHTVADAHIALSEGIGLLAEAFAEALARSWLQASRSRSSGAMEENFHD